MATEKYIKDFLRADSYDEAKEELEKVYEANPDAVIIVEEEGKECLIEHGNQLNFVPSGGQKGQVLLSDEEGNPKWGELNNNTGGDSSSILIKLEEIDDTVIQEGIDCKIDLSPYGLKNGDSVSFEVDVVNQGKENGYATICIRDTDRNTLSNFVSGQVKAYSTTTIRGTLTIDREFSASPYLNIESDQGTGGPMPFKNLILVRGTNPMPWDEGKDSSMSDYALKPLELDFMNFFGSLFGAGDDSGYLEEKEVFEIIKAIVEVRQIVFTNNFNEETAGMYICLSPYFTILGGNDIMMWCRWDEQAALIQIEVGSRSWSLISLSATYSELTAPTLAIARSNSKNIGIQAGKQYFNEVVNRTISTYEGFSPTHPTATILSSSPITFEGENVLIPSEIPDSEYLLYKIEYLQTSDIKFVLVVSVTAMKTPEGGLKGKDVPVTSEKSMILNLLKK